MHLWQLIRPCAWERSITMNSDIDRKMKIISDKGVVYERDGLNDADYPVSIIHYDVRKFSSSPLQFHWHSELEIMYVERGSIVLYTDTEKHDCDAGGSLIIKGNAIHNATNRDDSEGSLYSIIFAPELIFGRPGGMLWNKYWVPFMNAPIQVIELRNKIQWQKDALEDILTAIDAIENHKQGYEFAVKGALCSCIAKMTSNVVMPEGSRAHIDTTDEKRLKTVLLYIRTHYSENITLDDISASANISKSECCRCFKRTLHQSPFEYLMRYRIHCASRRLCDTSGNDDMSISELALSSGFNNISYFNKIFKKYMHCTPTEYRRDMIMKNTDDSLSHVDFTI